MIPSESYFKVKLAQSPRELWAAQRLRYEVFVAELGGDGALVNHVERLEKDSFDDHLDHLLLIDSNGPADLDGVVGVYRLMPGDRLAATGRFYSAGEYDMDVLLQSGRKLLELGRSCLHANYRGGMAMHHLWTGLADYVVSHEVEVLFGTASFHGTDVAPLAQALSYLHHNHLAPPELRVRALEGHFQSMDLIAKDQIDRKAAMLSTPALIKAYLRLGGVVGEGAFIDHAFNTTDVCLVMDTTRMNAKARARLTADKPA